MLFQLQHKFPSKYGKLTVPNELGTESSVRNMFLDGFTKRDAVDGETGNRRLLRNVFTVRVVSELTPLVAATATRRVEDVNLNTPTEFVPNSSIPSGLTIVQ